MQVFTLRDIERTLHLSRNTVRSLIESGYVAPARGKRGQFEFSFRDLVALRAARSLLQASVSPRRITRALKELRRNLPESAPLSGLRVCASGSEVIVRDDSRPWQTTAGQYLFEFEVQVNDNAVHIIERPLADRTTEAEEHFTHALQLDETDAKAALAAYQRCMEADPDHLGARINCGRLLHEAERLAEAEALYRAGMSAAEADPTLLFNLGVLLEDSGRDPEAVEVYQRVVEIDPDFADAHYNLALLFQRLEVPRAAIRHLNWYRRLTAQKL